ncbi:MAG: RNA recognition motif-containing protein [Trizodia sp. TS-e1964]|nr:MAG: RNA recognition motif-containing protein [Trizodia sp. TS-e1964]
MTSQLKRKRVSEDSEVLKATQSNSEGPEPSQKKDKSSRQRRSLFIRSLPTTATTESLIEHFSQSFPIKHATVVSDPVTRQSKGYAFVTFADAEDAEQAKINFDNSVFQGRKIRVDIAEPRQREIATTDSLTGHRKNIPSIQAFEAKAKREKQKEESKIPPKLIVRNLPWSIKEPEQLALLFRSYGKVKHATIPKAKPGLVPGFGFVVLRGRKNAEKALKEVNGKEIDGRTLAVDWAVEKNIWDGLQKEKITQTSLKKQAIPEACEDELPSPENENTEPYAEEDVFGTSENGTERLDEKIDDFDGDDNVSQSHSEQHPKKDQNFNNTLFVRNIPFSCSDEILAELFARFGPIRYARVVIDHQTERPKGTGFVCFFNDSDAHACLVAAPVHQTHTAKVQVQSKLHASAKQSILENESADQAGQFTMDGRVLQVSRAVDRNEAAKLSLAGNNMRDTRDRDKRRLYLLSEGTISSDSPLYNYLAPSEIAMREASAKQRQNLIRNNPMLHISLTRLSIRNIPRNITSKELKALAREAVVGFAEDVKAGVRQQLSKEEEARGGDEMKELERQRKSKGKGIVKQAKIVFEGREGGKVTEESGAGRSRGYGFLEYTSHRWALMGLRWLNGHAVGSQIKDESKTAKGEMSGRKKRLIVEFAIENAQVVSRRKELEAKARDRSKLVVEKRQNGENPKSSKRELSRDAIMAKTRKGMKRKRDVAKESDSANAGPKDQVISTDQDRLLKRQRIISKKRAVRKLRNRTFTT